MASQVSNQIRQYQLPKHKYDLEKIHHQSQLSSQKQCTPDNLSRMTVNSSWLPIECATIFSIHLFNLHL